MPDVPSVDGVAREVAHQVAVAAQGAPQVVVELAVDTQVERLACGDARERTDNTLSAPRHKLAKHDTVSRALYKIPHRRCPDAYGILAW